MRHEKSVPTASIHASQTGAAFDVGPEYGDETNYLRVYLNQIRRKLEPEPASPRYFMTEPGVGYRFNA